MKYSQVLNKKLYFWVILFCAICFCFISLSSFSLAQSTNTDTIQVTGEYRGNPLAGNWELVPCDGSAYRPCDWAALLLMVKRFMSLLFYLSAVIATLSFAYAGFLYLTAFGQMAKVEQAHGIFTKVVTGFIFVFLAWLIVASILSTLGAKKAFSLIDFQSVPKFEVTEGSAR